LSSREGVNLGRHSFTGEFPEVLVVMQTELGSFDFARDDRIKGAKNASLGMTGYLRVHEESRTTEGAITGLGDRCPLTVQKQAVRS
jgi:hypothetical protein